MPATNVALRQEFDDADLFIETMSRSGGIILPMAKGPWRATLAVGRLGGLTLYRAEVPPQIRQGAVAQGDVVMVSSAPPGAVRHLGHDIGPGEISLVGTGTVIETRYHHPATWAGVQFAPGALAALADAWGPAIPCAGGHGILRAGRSRRARVMATIETSLAAATDQPDLLANPAAAAGIEDSVTQAVLHALAEADDWVALPRATAARRRIVHDAVAWLEASPPSAWTIAALHTALGVAPRTLHGAFAAVHGCSPHAFLKRWRLALVRRALLRAGPGVLVKTIALDHGFWHLGHFAIDYRTLFGESPQETRRRSPRGAPGFRLPAPAAP